MEEKGTALGENADLRVERRGDHLEGRTIALCVTGGIAAIETPKLARQLRRHGAVVQAYVTDAALQFVGTAALEWATEREVIHALSGRAEHICREDAVVVAPATLNTINGIIAGLANNPVTTLVASALGARKPVLVAPTMHESLYQNPILQRNLADAHAYGITLIPP